MSHDKDNKDCPHELHTLTQSYDDYETPAVDEVEQARAYYGDDHRATCRYETHANAGCDCDMPYIKTLLRIVAQQAAIIEGSRVKGTPAWQIERDQLRAELAAAQSERDDYKSRWEQTGCTRHHAMETAISLLRKEEVRRAAAQSEIDRLQALHLDRTKLTHQAFTERDSAQSELAAVRDLLQAAKCPNECVLGVIVGGDGIEPCQWCAERELALQEPTK